MSSVRAPRASLALLAALVVAATALALVVQPSADQIEDTFGIGGVIGPLAFVALYVLATIAFVPAAPLTLAAGALYGVGGGWAVVMVGASLGAVAAFALGRRGARATVERASGERFAAIERRLEGKGFYALLAMRLLPIVPFNALNYAAGASPIKTREYVIGTVVGIAPGALVYTSLGAGVDDPISPLFIGAVVLTIALGLAAHLYSGRLDQRSEGV